MKSTKRNGFLRGLLPLLCLLLALSCLVSCDKTGGTQTPPAVTTEPSETPGATDSFTGKVTVLDHTGSPKDGILISFESLDMMKMTRNGSAEFTLPAGIHHFSVVDPDAEVVYDETICVLSADAKEVTVTLYGKPKSEQTLWGYSPSKDDHVETKAAILGVGAYLLPLEADERNYIIFAPTQGGIYRIAVNATEPVTPGYYGSPFNVLRENLTPLKDGALELEVHPTSIGIQLVVGLDAPIGVESGVVTITRIGDYVPSPADQPWTVLKADEADLVPYYVDYLNWSVSFQALDLQDKDLTVVLNEADGYYHLGDKNGPVVFLLLDEDSPYLPSFTTICETDHLGCYFYDSDGAFLKKESYGELLAQYTAICDAHGAVPLNEQLAYVLQTLGNDRGWWDFSKEQHIFGDTVVEADTAWLFACGTYTINKSFAGSTESPVSLTTEGRVLLTKDTALSVTVRNNAALTLTVTDPDGCLTLTYNGQTYTAENGCIEVTLTDGNKVFTLAIQSDAEINEADVTLTIAE